MNFIRVMSGTFLSRPRLFFHESLVEHHDQFDAARITYGSNDAPRSPHEAPTAGSRAVEIFPLVPRQFVRMVGQSRSPPFAIRSEIPHPRLLLAGRLVSLVKGGILRQNLARRFLSQRVTTPSSRRGGKNQAVAPSYVVPVIVALFRTGYSHVVSCGRGDGQDATLFALQEPSLVAQRTSSLKDRSGAPPVTPRVGFLCQSPLPFRGNER